MKQPTQSGTALLGGWGRALILVAAFGLLLALMICLPNIRASLRGGASREQSSSGRVNVRAQRKAPAEAELSGGAAGTAASPSMEPKGSIRQAIVSRVKTVHRLPTTANELEATHEQARGEACEPIPAGEAREINSFAPYLTQRDYREVSDGKVTALSARQHVFSVGFDMLESDRRRLPRISGGVIMRYLSNQFISLQVRVQKDLSSEVLHLHHRPLAAVASFRQRRLTQEPTETLARSLRNYRSLGLFLADGLPAIPENLRTLVLLHKSEREASGLARATVKYEFVFVRALDDLDGVSPKLKCHTFATSDDRTVLHYLQPGEDPSRPEACSVKTMLYFTEYTDRGLRPVASVSRGSIFDDRAKYSIESLNGYARSQGWEGDALDNLTKTLDALIDGRVPSQQ